MGAEFGIDDAHIDFHASELSQLYGWPKDKASILIKRAGCELAPWLVSKGDKPVTQPREHLFQVLHLKEGVECRGSAALDLLLSETDLNHFAEGFHIIEFLRSPMTPFYTLDGLANAIEGLVEHVLGEQEVLLETGLTKHLLWAHRWLDWHLARLYFVRFARGFKWKDEATDTTQYTFQYPPSADFTRLDASPKPVLEYDEAPLLRGLSTSNASRAERLRPRVLDLKFGILRLLVKHIRSGKHKGMWKSCERLVRKHLTDRSARFLLRMDRYYVGTDVTEEPPDHWSGLDPGGLSSLLTVVGHVEFEMRFHAIDQCARAFAAHAPPLVFDISGVSDDARKALSETIGIPFREYLGIRSYYDAIGQPWRSALDKTLVAFDRADARGHDFWKAFRCRINRCLRRLDSEVVAKQRVPRRLAVAFRGRAQGYLDYVGAHLRTAGVFPDDGRSALPVAPNGEAVPSGDQPLDGVELLSKEAKALAILAAHSDWPMGKIADALGVGRTTLYDWPAFKTAWMRLHPRPDAKGSSRKGFKNAKTRDVDVWDEDAPDPSELAEG